MQSGRMSSEGDVAVVTLSTGKQSTLDSCLVSPTVIDAMIQSSFLASISLERFEGIRVPFSIDQAWIRPGAAQRLRSAATCTAHVEMRSAQQDKRVDQNASIVDCTLLSADGEVVVYIRGLMCRSISADAVSAGSADARHGKHLSLAATWVEQAATRDAGYDFEDLQSGEGAGKKSPNQEKDDNEDEEVVNFCCCVIEGIIVLSVGKEDEDE